VACDSRIQSTDLEERTEFFSSETENLTYSSLIFLSSSLNCGGDDAAQSVDIKSVYGTKTDCASRVPPSEIRIRVVVHREPMASSSNSSLDRGDNDAAQCGDIDFVYGRRTDCAEAGTSKHAVRPRRLSHIPVCLGF
jgi:hypothetical protein